MRTKRMNRTIGAALFGLATVTTPVVTAGVAQAHGFTQNPPSRQALCADGTVDDCGPIQREPQSVEGLGDFPQGGPADGHLCSGGNERFAALDDPRGGRWPATPVRAGQQMSFRWKITAAHSTESFRYYITANGWDPSEPLTRDQLEPAPFHQVGLGGRKPGATVTHEVALPGNKKGRHVIFAVWEIADTGNAFYSCSDVVFGESARAEPAGDTSDGGMDAPANTPTATASTASGRSGGGIWSWFRSVFG